MVGEHEYEGVGGEQVVDRPRPTGVVDDPGGRGVRLAVELGTRVDGGALGGTHCRGLGNCSAAKE